MQDTRYSLRALARLIAYPDAQLRSELDALLHRERVAQLWPERLLCEFMLTLSDDEAPLLAETIRPAVGPGSLLDQGPVAVWPGSIFPVALQHWC